MSFSKKIAIISLIAGVVLLAVTGFYAYHFSHNPVHHIPSRASRNVNAIQEWMTVKYIARTYGVPEQILLDTLGITSQQANHQSIKSIAKLQHKDVTTVLTNVRTTVKQYKGLP